MALMTLRPLTTRMPLLSLTTLVTLISRMTLKTYSTGTVENGYKAVDQV